MSETTLLTETWAVATFLFFGFYWHSGALIFAGFFLLVPVLCDYYLISVGEGTTG